MAPWMKASSPAASASAGASAAAVRPGGRTATASHSRATSLSNASSARKRRRWGAGPRWGKWVMQTSLEGGVSGAEAKIGQGASDGALERVKGRGAVDATPFEDPL